MQDKWAESSWEQLNCKLTIREFVWNGYIRELCTNFWYLLISSMVSELMKSASYK